MSGSLTAQLVLKLISTGLSSTLGLGTADDPVSKDYSKNFSSGTGANQASNQWHDQRTLTASSSENLDLAGVLTNAFGVTLTFTAIKALLIFAAAANTNDVIVGGAASNGWITWVGGATHTVTVKPGGLLLLVAPNATGYTVTAATGDILKVANSSSGTSVTYDIIVWGID